MTDKIRHNDVVLAKIKASDGQVVELLAIVCRVLDKEDKIVVSPLEAGGHYTVSRENVTKKSWMEVK